MKAKSALLLLTAGRDGKEDGYIPDANGMKRINAGIDLVRRGNIDVILFVGGDKGPDVESLAATYSRYGHGRLRAVRGQDFEIPIITEAADKLTPRDLAKFSRSSRMDSALGIGYRERASVKIFIPVYRRFFNRVSRTLGDLGYTNLVWIDSGEKPHYTLCQEWLLSFTTLVDPCFDRTPLGRAIVAKAHAER
jgi:hypothetical protein